MEGLIIDNLKKRVIKRMENEFEIYALIIIFGIWYYLNIGGAIWDDETIFAFQGYLFYKGDMPAEQFRPMGRYIFGLGQQIFGMTTLGTKFFIPILGILAMYLTYKVTRNLTDNRILGLLSSLFVGIIPRYQDLSVSGLMDIIMAFFVMLLLYAAIKFIDSEDLIRKQRLLFILGFLSLTTVSTKLYGLFFSVVIFLFIVFTHWSVLRTIQLFRIRNMKPRFRKNMVLIPVFSAFGALFGLLIRLQLSELWKNAGDRGRSDVLGVLPGFMGNIVADMNSTHAYIFFIVVGVMIFLVLWIIAALVGRESLRILKCIYKKQSMDTKYHVLIYIVGAVIGFCVIYSPYLSNPVALFTQIILNQTIRTTAGAPRVIAGVSYENAPWWAYFYWTYADLGLMYVIGLLISIGYTAIKYIKKEEQGQKLNLLVFYILLPFILMSILKVKHDNYYVMFFPLFSILMVAQTSSLLKRAFKSMPLMSSKYNSHALTVIPVTLLILLPGPLWMTLEDPAMGWDSGYDRVGELINDYYNDHPKRNITVVAFDTLSVEFYLSDEIKEDIFMLPLFSDNYSTDILGRPYVYITDEDLYNMAQNSEIDMLIDQPKINTQRESALRRFAVENSTGQVTINEQVIVFYLIP